MNSDKIFVTGAAGFIGYHLCKKLLENNFSGIFNLVEISCSEIPFSARNFARSKSKVLSRKDHS